MSLSERETADFDILVGEVGDVLPGPKGQRGDRLGWLTSR